MIRVVRRIILREVLHNLVEAEAETFSGHVDLETVEMFELHVHQHLFCAMRNSKND